MAILKNIELWWTKIDPKKPVVINERDDGTKVTGWEIEGRTTDKAQANAWKEVLGKKAVVAFREDKEDDESPIKYWRIKLRKKQYNAEGEETDPVEVVRADTLDEMDGRTIGNESVGDVRIFQYPYSFKQNGQLVEGNASVLQAISVTKLVKYTPKAREEFEKGNFEVVDDEDEEEESGGSAYVEHDDEPKSKRRGRPKKNQDIDDEIPF